MRKMRLRFMHTIFIVKLMLYGLFATKTFSSTRKFKELFHETITAKIFIATKMYTRDALETDVLFGTTFSATNNFVSRGKGKALETRKQKEFANGVARKLKLMTRMLYKTNLSEIREIFPGQKLGKFSLGSAV